MALTKESWPASALRRARLWQRECRLGINPYHQPLSKAVINVPAGATVTAEWRHTLNQTPKDPADPINASHKGPVISYLAKWFKIYEDGLTVSDQSWVVDRLVANKGKVSFKIPSCIASGQYLLRQEIIALHCDAASSYPGAQFYMEYAQINVTGRSHSKSPVTVSFPGAYHGTDPAIKINIYQNLKDYTIQGPAVFAC
ncbi:hypothetical protein BV20DRAFT_1053988 [Pilatotrama ljubarskyi]|nr:hypothetical protein BV20DRAFT_1053988 [Pilatotrama ljubarskyi]